MVADYLRRLDTDDAIIMDVYAESQALIEILSNKDLKTPHFDRFLNGLKDDEDSGNIEYHFESHHIILQQSSKPLRKNRDAQKKTDLVRTEAKKIKGKVIKNLIDNISEQSQKGTIIEYASAFNLSFKCDKETRVKNVKELFSIYGTAKTHTVKNDDACTEALPGYKIEIEYEPKLQCTETEIIESFDEIWPKLNILWLSFKKTKPEKNVTKRFWIKVLELYSIDFPNLAELIMILLAISPGTGPLERSYSKLAKTCFKDRARISADTLETLYLLCCLQIKNGDDELFKKVRDALQK